MDHNRVCRLLFRLVIRSLALKLLLKPSWGHFGVILGHLGAILGLSWGCLAAPRGPFLSDVNEDSAPSSSKGFDALLKLL